MLIRKLSFIYLIISIFLSSCSLNSSPLSQGVFVKGQQKNISLDYFVGPPYRQPELVINDNNPIFTINLPDLIKENFLLLSYESSNQVNQQLSMKFNQVKNEVLDIYIQELPEPDVYCFVMVDSSKSIDMMDHWCFEYTNVPTDKSFIDPEGNSTSLAYDLNDSLFNSRSYSLLTSTNAKKIEEIRRFGKGKLYDLKYSSDGSYFAVLSSIGIFLYSSDTYQEIKFIETGFFSGIHLLPDGKSIATWSEEQNIHIWNIENGNLIYNFENFDNPIKNVSFSSNGEYIAAWTSSELSIWNLTNKKMDNKISESFSSKECVKFSRDSSLLAFGTDDGKIHIWDTRNKELTDVFEGHQNSVLSIDFSRDGQYLASGSKDKTIILWDLVEGNLAQTLVGHSDSINELLFSPDQETLAAASNDGNIIIWNLDSGNQIKSFLSNKKNDNIFTFSPNGTIFVFSSPRDSFKKETILWDLKNGALLNTLNEPSGFVINYNISLDNDSVLFSPDGNTIVTFSQSQGLARFWNVKSGSLKKILGDHSEVIFTTFFSKNDAMIATGSYNGKILLRNIDTGEIIHSLDGHSSLISTLKFSSDGSLLASGSIDKTIRVWDVNTGECINTIPVDNELSYDLTFSPDGKILAGGLVDNSIGLWDVSNWKLKNSLRGSFKYIFSLAFSPDGKYLSTTESSNVVVFDLSDGSLIHTFPTNTMPLTLKFSPDGTILANGGHDHSVYLWDIVEGDLIIELSGHESSVVDLEFSPDGKLLITGSWDGTVVVWSIEEGFQIYKVQGNYGQINSVTFSPNGDIFSFSGLENIYLVDTYTKNILTQLSNHNDLLYDLVFSPDGKYLISGSEDGTFRIWGVSK